MMRGLLGILSCAIYMGTIRFFDLDGLLLMILNGDISMGRYTEDFYKDTAAITCRCHGNGKAYYQAARCSVDGLSEFIKGLLTESGIEVKDIPAGIEYHKRIGKEAAYEFYVNVTSDIIELTNVEGINLMTGNQISGSINLGVREYLVLKNKL